MLRGVNQVKRNNPDSMVDYRIRELDDTGTLLVVGQRLRNQFEPV
jgi:hypothetical protein